MFVNIERLTRCEPFLTNNGAHCRLYLIVELVGPQHLTLIPLPAGETVNELIGNIRAI